MNGQEETERSSSKTGINIAYLGSLLVLGGLATFAVQQRYTLFLWFVGVGMTLTVVGQVMAQHRRTISPEDGFDGR